MPNRVVRESYLDSENVNLLTAEQERFYFRLYLVVDDFGKFRALPSLLKAKCFPIKEDITEQQVAEWLFSLPKSLVLIYEVDGKKYLKINKFKQRLRNMVSRYPDPPNEEKNNNDGHVTDGCQSKDGQRTEGSEVHAFYSLPFSSDSSSDSDSDSDSKKLLSTTYCKRNGKKVQCSNFGGFVKLTPDEYRRMVAEWGETFTREAITQYDLKSNNPAVQRHTDHNRGIRDYVNRGFICTGKTPRPQTSPTPTLSTDPSEIGTPEERADALNNPFTDRGKRKRGGDPQSVGEILNEMRGGP